MAQTAKFIDITRTFIPIDPNSFPETLSEPSGSSTPEEKTPVMAYKGYNFMPTSYGYKSYFGVNAKLNIDDAPADVDELFIYQNVLLENVLIALCASGIWVKKGTAVGAWEQLVTYTPPGENVHYLWTTAIIADKLYAYMQGKPTYYLIDSDLTDGVTAVSKTPNFLNMLYQVGIFRAAGRLAFWDVTDSMAWSNIDDFTDFEPSLETLAGNATFSDVQGKIITVLSHGEGFMIYASKSIVYISANTANLYQWKPQVLLPSTGIQYPRQACIASPDTIHFAYTTEGLKKITKSVPETIVTEITDFLKDTPQPIYLKVLEGRFLFLEMMDDSYIIGKIQNGENSIPSETYKFDGSEYTLADVIIPDEPAGFCPTLDGIDNGEFDDVVPGGPNSPTPAPGPANGNPAPHPTAPNYKPEWTCWISNNGAKDAGNLEWGPTPCPTLDAKGKEVNMCPIGALTQASLTTNETNKKAVKGEDAYIDGWTMERFMAVQSAIWEAEDKALEAVIKAILARENSSNNEDLAATCTPSTPAANYCELGNYVKGFSAPKFGFNSCSFWLTRYATDFLKIKRKRQETITCQDSDAEYGPVNYVTSTFMALGDSGATVAALSGVYSSASAIGTELIAMKNGVFPVATSYTGPTILSINMWGNQNPGPNAIVAVDVATSEPYVGDAGYAGVSISFSCEEGYTLERDPVTFEPSCVKHVNPKKRTGVVSTNVGEPITLAPTPESGFCSITGWTYTDAEGKAARMNATTCTSANGGTPKPGGTSSTGAGASNFNKAPIDAPTDVPIDPETGLVCGQGADGFTLDGETITWPGSEVIIPASSFLFSLGSYAPLYPTINGAFVYDLQLKKWGKMHLSYKLLLDYSPINSSATGLVAASVFGILGGILDTEKKIRLFDTSPSDSYITYGKVGYYRLGKTSVEEVRVDFRAPSTGSIETSTSIDGAALVPALDKVQGFVGQRSATLFGVYPGAWINITIRGVYDISYLEYRGFKQGRR